MLKRINQQRGVGLIEVMSSMLILSVGVLGMVSVQSRSVQFNQGTLFESKAVAFAGDLMERIRANPGQKSRYRIGMNDSTPSYSSCDGAGANCDVRALADYDVGTWRDEISENLPEGNGEVIELPGLGGSSVFVITVQYQDSRVEDGSASGQGGVSAAEPRQIVFRTSI